MQRDGAPARLRRLFIDGFIAMDVAEPLVSFDGDRDAAPIAAFMEERRLRVVGVREGGVVVGQARRADLEAGRLSSHAHPFADDLALDENASLQEVVPVLDREPQCFVSVLGQVGAIITRTDIGKPPARMWLFGMITIIEMYLVRVIERRFADTWQERVAPGRLEKARELQEERRRRRQEASLVDCLQLGDKARLLLQDPELRADSGYPSMRAAERAIKQLESLRNHLAHSQDIVAHDWEAIVDVAGRLDRIMTRA